jgi:hypothetical protein
MVSPRASHEEPNGRAGQTSLGKEGERMTETWQGDFYCVKCKEKRAAEGNVVETNGRRMAKGTCPVCGTNLNRILGKA